MQMILREQHRTGCRKSRGQWEMRRERLCGGVPVSLWTLPDLIQQIDSLNADVVHPGAHFVVARPPFRTAPGDCTMLPTTTNRLSLLRDANP